MRWRCPPDKLGAAVADDGVEPLGQLVDELAAARRIGGALDLLVGRIGPAVADVLEHRAMKQRDVLRHDGDCVAQALLGEQADILPLDEDLAHPAPRAGAAAARAKSICRRLTARQDRPSRPGE
jgi:hypothetical protein